MLNDRPGCRDAHWTHIVLPGFGGPLPLPEVSWRVPWTPPPWATAARPSSRATLWQDDIDNEVDGAEELLANAFTTDKWAKQISEGAQSFLQGLLAVGAPSLPTQFRACFARLDPQFLMQIPESEWVRPTH